MSDSTQREELERRAFSVRIRVALSCRQSLQQQQQRSLISVCLFRLLSDVNLLCSVIIPTIIIIIIITTTTPITCLLALGFGPPTPSHRDGHRRLSQLLPRRRTHPSRPSFLFLFLLFKTRLCLRLRSHSLLGTIGRSRRVQRAHPLLSRRRLGVRHTHPHIPAAPRRRSASHRSHRRVQIFTSYAVERISSTRRDRGRRSSCSEYRREVGHLCQSRRCAECADDVQHPCELYGPRDRFASTVESGEPLRDESCQRQGVVLGRWGGGGKVV